MGLWERSYAMLKAYLFFDDTDLRIVRWMRRYGVIFLRISIGIIFIWFGALKLMGGSPATDLVANTVYWFDPAWFIPVLGIWEMIIGILFLIPSLTRAAIFLLVPQMLGTFLPLVLLPDVVFQHGNVFLTTLEPSKASTSSRTSSSSAQRLSSEAMCAM
jgi:uncharacterized membrane protein YkgB